jgi:hypothetical protein
VQENIPLWTFDWFDETVTLGKIKPFHKATDFDGRFDALNRTRFHPRYPEIPRTQDSKHMVNTTESRWEEEAVRNSQ